MAQEYQGRIAVVAGGGSGIGRGTAHRLASLGYTVILVGRSADKLDRVVAEIAAAGGTARAFAADVTDWKRLAELGESLAENGIDVLIHSAGGQFTQASAELTEEGWREVVDKNLTGAFFMLRHLHPALAKRQGAAVMVVANMWAKPSPYLAHSAASRAGVVNLARTLAMEWADKGIRINAVAPGLTNTEALPDMYRKLVDRVPLKRIGEVDEVVDALLFLAHSRYITGEVIAVDGGLRFT